MAAKTANIATTKMKIDKFYSYIKENAECNICHGEKVLKCHVCDGKEVTKCGKCKGEGTIDGEKCPYCLGDKEEICTTCNGDGVIPCPKCRENHIDESIHGDLFQRLDDEDRPNYKTDYTSISGTRKSDTPKGLEIFNKNNIINYVIGKSDKYKKSELLETPMKDLVNIYFDVKYTPKNVNESKEECELCHNKHEICCKACNGKRTHECPECSGRGCNCCNHEGEVICKDCLGYGKCECPECYKDSKNDCGKCDGKGVRICKECDGEGCKNCDERGEIVCNKCS